MKVLIIALLSAAVARASLQSCAVNDSKKTDCGFMGVTEDQCLTKGCCWYPLSEGSSTPWCYASEGVGGYTLSNFKETILGYEGSLSLSSQSSITAYGDDIKELKLSVIFETDSVFRIKITDAENARFEVPSSIVNRKTAIKKAATQKYTFKYTESPFSFQVLRKEDDAVLFDMGSSNLVFKDQYLELTTAIDTTAKTFGLGESARLSQALSVGKYTLWGGDIPAMTKDVNLYGSYPYYVQVVNGKAHGAMLMNSNGMDVSVLPSAIQFKVVGGIIDLYVFTGSTPSEVVSQYTYIVGRPAMMPYWSFGFHNCKYGYTSISQVEDVVSKYAAAGIPLDTQWIDIDYMQNYRDFTTDSVNFPSTEVASFVGTLHANGMHFVPIVDPGIMVKSGDAAYESGMKAGVFIKDVTGGYYLGQVWPGPTYFPDFTHPKAQNWWTKEIKAFHDLVSPDGLWIDMNEIANFCNGDGKGQVCANTAPSGCPAAGASQTTCCLECNTVDPSNKYDFPPYNIGNYKGLLSGNTVSMSSYHYNNKTVYDMHNLYGLTEQIATNKALADIRQQRPFVLSRSSFISTGAHSAKWTGDNSAQWDDLKSSIVSVMDFNLFGVPMIGADICGFLMDTTEELCARWIEVGAFYPFSRNHNALGSTPQELYLWPSVTAAAHNALSIRYQLLPYMYTLMYKASTEGATVARALWVNYPLDSATLSLDRQFMIGSAILVSPVLDQGATSVSAYFPKGLWYNFNTLSLDVTAATTGVTKVIPTPLTAVNVHICGGNILPLQQSAMTTTLARQTPFTLVVALDLVGVATGELFYDDGEQVTVTKFLRVSFDALNLSGGGSLASKVSTNTYSGASSLKVEKVVVLLGVSSSNSAIKTATLNGVGLSSDQMLFDSANQMAIFSDLGVQIAESISLKWTF